MSVTYARRNELSAGTQFNGELKRGVRTLQQAYVNADDPAPNNDRIVAEAAQAEVIVVGSYVNITSETATADAPRAFADLISRLIATGKPVVLLSFGTPYLLNQVPSVQTYGVAWGGSAASQVAAARALLGEIPIVGKLPTSIPPYVTMGAGEQRGPRQ
jgi:beta-N-acetylhexosaminidase